VHFILLSFWNISVPGCDWLFDHEKGQSPRLYYPSCLWHGRRRPNKAALGMSCVISTVRDLTILIGTWPSGTPWGTTKIFAWRYPPTFFFRGRKSIYLREIITRGLVYHRLEPALDWPGSWNCSGSVLFAAPGNFYKRSLGGLRRHSSWGWWVKAFQPLLPLDHCINTYHDELIYLDCYRLL